MKNIFFILGIACTLLAGCDPSGSVDWKDKFVKEVNYHYATQQVKNAEIAAHQLEIANQRIFIQILEKKIKNLEASSQSTDANNLRPLLRHSDPVLVGKVTALDNELGLVVISLGSEAGVHESSKFSIYRGDNLVAEIDIDRVEAKWAAGKIQSKKTTPRIGDTVKSHETLAGNEEGIDADEVSGDLKAHFGISKGMFIVRVEPDFPGDKLGLKESDVIPEVGPAQLLEALRAGGPIKVLRKGIPITLPQNP